MAWTTEGTAVNGATILASFWNTNVRDNLDVSEAVVITTANDIVYATGSHALARLAAGTDRKVLRVNSGATAPEWSMNAPSSSMYMDGNGLNFQTITTATDTTVNFITSEFDYNSTGTLATGKLTAKATGLYLVNSTITLQFTTAISYQFSIRIKRFNSSAVLQGEYVKSNEPILNGSTNQTSIGISRNISAIIPMTDTDYIQIIVKEDNGSNKNTIFKSAGVAFRVSAIFSMSLL